MADGSMSAKFMKSAFVGWTMSAGVYYPPDFDASKLMPMKALKPKGPQMMNIRMMFPFTMVCDECKEYNYTGTKFTAKVEVIKGESFLGLKVYRFYGRCRHCWSEFTFKTDPKNSDYTMESGGKRTYEAWKDADAMETQMKQEKEKEASQDHMKALEQKAVDVQSEMQRLEDLDAIRTMNRRLGARDQTIQEALDFIFKRDVELEAQKDLLPEGDMSELQSFQEAQEERKRKLLDDEVDLANEVQTPAASSTSIAAGSSILSTERAKEAPKSSSVGARFTVKVKRKEDLLDDERVAKRSNADTSDASVKGPEAPPSGSTGIGLGTYDSSEESN